MHSASEEEPMHAVGVYQALPTDDPRCVIDVELPVPVPNPRDILVHVEAVSVNPIDVKTRAAIQGTLQEPRVLGWDASGTVAQIGSEVTYFKEGDELYYAGSINRPGCCSEYHLVDERIAALKPKSLSFEKAAAMPLTSLTAWEGLFDRLGVSHRNESDDTVLIIGGAGGVGSIAIQIAKKAAGMRVIATASRPESSAWCLEMGADAVISHAKPLEDELSRIGVKDVPYIFCLNSTAAYLEAMISILRPQGRICPIVAMPEGHLVDLNAFRAKSAGLIWELMFTRSVWNTVDMVRQHEILHAVAELIDNRTLTHTMRTSFDTLDARTVRNAHTIIESGSTIGKVVLRRAY